MHRQSLAAARFARRRAWLVGLAMGATSCADTIIDGDDYSAACVQSSDCVLVAVGDACEACLTHFEPIHDGELTEFLADADRAVEQCPPWAERFHLDCVASLPDTGPLCQDGACVVPEEGAPCRFDDGFCRGSD